MGNGKKRTPKSIGARARRLRQKKAHKEIFARKERMKGGPPNCLICLHSLQNNNANKDNESTSTSFTSDSCKTLPPTGVAPQLKSKISENVANHLCRLVRISKVFYADQLQNYHLCFPCQEKIQKMLRLEKELSDVTCGFTTLIFREAKQEMESLILSLQDDFSRFQVSSVLKQVLHQPHFIVPGGIHVLRAKIHCELVYLKSSNTKDSSSSTLLPQLSVREKNRIEASGPPNCLVCLRGPSAVNVELGLNRLSSSESYYLSQLLDLSNNAKNDMADPELSYVCSECHGYVKGLSVLYSKVEEICVELADAHQFLASHILKYRVPRSDSAIKRNVTIAPFLRFRSRIEDELKAAQSQRRSKFWDVPLNENGVRPRPKPRQQPPKSINLAEDMASAEIGSEPKNDCEMPLSSVSSNASAQARINPDVTVGICAGNNMNFDLEVYNPSCSQDQQGNPDHNHVDLFVEFEDQDAEVDFGSPIRAGNDEIIETELENTNRIESHAPNSDENKAPLSLSQQIAKYKELRKKKTPFPCSYCGINFSAKCGLKRHIVRFHTQDYNFRCQFCQKGFHSSRYLREHEQYKHQGIKPYLCPICGKGFSCRKNLDVHEAKHSGIRSFQCKRCEKNYIAASALQKHVAAIHGNEKYICELCGKELPSKHYLNIHMKAHRDKEAGVKRNYVSKRKKQNNNSMTVPVLEAAMGGKTVVIQNDAATVSLGGYPQTTDDITSNSGTAVSTVCHNFQDLLILNENVTGQNHATPTN